MKWPVFPLLNINNAKRKPTVTSDYFEVIDNGGSPDATDAYLRIAFDLTFPNDPRLVATQAPVDNPYFLSSQDAGEIFLLPSSRFGSASITLPNKTVTTEPRVYLKPFGFLGMAQAPGAILVTDGGSVGSMYDWEDSSGNVFTIYDIGTEAASYYPMVTKSGEALGFDPSPNTAVAANSYWVLDSKNGKTGIWFGGTADVSYTQARFDSGASATNRVFQDSGASITVSKDNVVGGHYEGTNNNALWVKVFRNPANDRFEHDGNGQVQFSIDVQILIGNRFFPVYYSATASAGQEVRVHSTGFSGYFNCDTGTGDELVALSNDSRPNQEIKGAS